MIEPWDISDTGPGAYLLLPHMILRAAWYLPFTEESAGQSRQPEPEPERPAGPGRLERGDRRAASRGAGRGPRSGPAPRRLHPRRQWTDRVFSQCLQALVFTKMRNQPMVPSPLKGQIVPGLWQNGGKQQGPCGVFCDASSSLFKEEAPFSLRACPLRPFVVRNAFS